MVLETDIITLRADNAHGTYRKSSLHKVDERPRKDEVKGVDTGGEALDIAFVRARQAFQQAGEVVLHSEVGGAAFKDGWIGHGGGAGSMEQRSLMNG